MKGIWNLPTAINIPQTESKGICLNLFFVFLCHLVGCCCCCCFRFDWKTKRDEECCCLHFSDYFTVPLSCIFDQCQNEMTRQWHGILNERQEESQRGWQRRSRGGVAPETRRHLAAHHVAHVRPAGRHPGPLQRLPFRPVEHRVRRQLYRPVYAPVVPLWHSAPLLSRLPRPIPRLQRHRHVAHLAHFQGFILSSFSNEFDFLKY